MLQDESFQDLLFGGLEDRQSADCRAWVDRYKEAYKAATDLEAIQDFSDKTLLLHIIGAYTLFSSKSLLTCDFIGLPTPRFEVRALNKEGCELVAIHEGFLHLLGFMNECSLLSFVLWDHLKHVPKDQATTLDLHLKLNKLRLARRFLKNPFRLPSFVSSFSEELKTKMTDEMEAMLAFAIHHELAHHYFRHVTKTGTTHAQPLVCEYLNYFKNEEFEADLSAIQAVREGMDLYVAGASLLLYHLALLESVSLDMKSTHPLAVNRIHQLEAALPPWTSEQARRSLTGMVQNMAKELEQYRKEGLGAAFELYSNAGVQNPIQELTTIADILLKGERIFSKYGGRTLVHPSRIEGDS